MWIQIPKPPLNSPEEAPRYDFSKGKAFLDDVSVQVGPKVMFTGLCQNRLIDPKCTGGGISHVWTSETLLSSVAKNIKSKGESLVCTKVNTSAAAHTLDRHSHQSSAKEV